MISTFRVSLCICMLGLCMAASSSRNVRWCVTSDNEEKKCKDLVNSCSIQEIPLICVKRSSTEDCMTAISNGDADAISLDSGDIYKASLKPYNLKPIVKESLDFYNVADAPCLKKQQKLREEPAVGAYVPQCDEKGNYSPQQCHGSTRSCWCVHADGEVLNGTRTGPGQKPVTCGVPVYAKFCVTERAKALREHPRVGAYVPECDEKGDYTPKQCHGGTGHCWCVNASGKEISGTRTLPGQTPPTCGVPVDTPCLKERQKLIKEGHPQLGAYVPDCDERGEYNPQQCHGSTGHCWCVTANGEEIDGTKTQPGQNPSECRDTDAGPCQYAVAVVKKSSTFQFNDLKGKRSCHSALGNTAGWDAPINVLHKKTLLQWAGPGKETLEKALSRFFSGSCIPGANEETLCKQCAGEGDKKCKRNGGEPYYGDDGAFRCLRDDQGDVAFARNTALSDKYSDCYELLCPDNTRKPISEYKDCNLGKVPAHAVVTRSTGDKTVDITEFLLDAQKKHCDLFSSNFGKDLLFKDSTKILIPLPSEMDAFLYLGAEFYKDIKALTEVHILPKNNIRWCTKSNLERVKCYAWYAVSGGAISCSETSSTEKCIEKILKGEADAVSVGSELLYTALKCGLVPAFDQYQNKDDLRLCKTTGPGRGDFGIPHVVALVKKSDKDITWKNLEGKKSCHTGVGHTISWNIPLSIISKQNNNNCDLGSYFGQSCAPGSPINSNLCELCIGDTKNISDSTKCSLSDKEAYYGNAGAFRCLVEKGDVAFLAHSVVFKNTDGKNPADWAKDLKSDDFELLCLDGSRAPVSDYKNCHLDKISTPAVVTRQDILADVVRIVYNQQALYGRMGSEKDIFQMFSSQIGEDLLFSDETQCLVEFDRLLDNVVIDYFGTDNPIPYDCTSKSGLLSACTFHHC